MSTRTIIEINHDHINDLTGLHAYVWNRLLLDLKSYGLNDKEMQFFASCGLRILGQRHHSETLNLEIK